MHMVLSTSLRALGLSIKIFRANRSCVDFFTHTLNKTAIHLFMSSLCKA